MRDYLTNLIGRSLGCGEMVCPRPIGFFETPPSVGKLAPECHSNPEAMEEEQTYSEVTPDAPSVILSPPRTKSAPQLSATGVQGDFKVRQHQMDNSSASSRWLSRQPTGQQLPSLGPIAPHSPEVKTDQRPPQGAPPEPELPPATTRQTGTSAKEQRPEQRPRPSAIYPAKPEPSQTAIHKTAQESIPDEPMPPLVNTRGDTVSLQSATAQQGEAKLEMATSPDMSERSDHLKASPASSVPFPEPRPIHSATIEPDLTRLHGRPHIELTNKIPVEPVVNITIGRIEVKATKVQELEQPRQQKKPSGVMSLDEYLSQSGWGGLR